MNAKKLVVLTVMLGLFAISSASVDAQMHRNSGFVSPASTSHSFVRPGTGTFHGGNWGGDWHHHHHDNSFIFISGFPFFGLLRIAATGLVHGRSTAISESPRRQRGSCCTAYASQCRMIAKAASSYARTSTPMKAARSGFSRMVVNTRPNGDKVSRCSAAMHSATNISVST